MLLDDRKRRILQAIIDDYIDTAEPVGSRTIARKHQLGLSSATIRNEMADLEEMGYLEQPHTSAGRVPSDRGYRLYVDELMKIRELTSDEINIIKRDLEAKISELGELVRHASNAMSRFTRYTSMAITPQIRKSVLKTIQVIPVESGKALVILLSSTGDVKNCMIRTPESIVPDTLVKISNILNERLSGCMIEQINIHSVKDWDKYIDIPVEELKAILRQVELCISQIDNVQIYLDGTTNIFNYPEFCNVFKAKEFLNMLDKSDILCKLLSCSNDNKGIKIQIGTENALEEIRECSLITATYSLGDVVIGSIGVIGPTRMEYSKVVSSMNYIRKKINQEINRILKDDE